MESSDGRIVRKKEWSYGIKREQYGLAMRCGISYLQRKTVSFK